MSDLLFGKYRLVAEIGGDGTADVLLVSEQAPAGFSRLLVLKRIREDLIEDPELVPMLLEEGRIAARMNHPNIVRILEVGSAGQKHFLTMEFLDGQSLREVRACPGQGEGFDSGLEYLALSDVLAGLHHAHQLTDYDGTPLSVVHREVTPANVWITYEGQVKIIEFGTAKAVGRAYETRMGVIRGNARYMAPEQASGEAVDRRADIFAVGAILWEAATGRSLWGERTDAEVMMELLAGCLPTLTSPSRMVPPAIHKMCSRALAPAREDRYPTAADFQAELDAFLDEAGLLRRRRELGTRTSALFAAARMKLRRTIEQKLARTHTSDDKPLPVLWSDDGDDQTTVTESVVFDASEEDLTQFAPFLRFKQELEDELEDKAEDEPQHNLENGAAVPVAGWERGIGPRVLSALPAAASVTPRHTTGGPRVQRAWLVLAAFGTVALSLAAVTAYGWRPWADGTSSAAVAMTKHQPSIASSVAAPFPELPSAVEVVLTASPELARFQIDDGPLLDNPSTVRMPRDDHEHEVQVTATGYHPRVIKIHTSKDIILEIALQKVPMAAEISPPRPPVMRRPLAHGAPAASAPKQPAPPATSARRPAAEIDRTNPW